MITETLDDSTGAITYVVSGYTPTDRLKTAVTEGIERLLAGEEIHFDCDDPDNAIKLEQAAEQYMDENLTISKHEFTRGKKVAWGAGGVFGLHAILYAIDSYRESGQIVTFPEMREEFISTYGEIWGDIAMGLTVLCYEACVAFIAIGLGWKYYRMRRSATKNINAVRRDARTIIEDFIKREFTLGDPDKS